MSEELEGTGQPPAAPSFERREVRPADDAKSVRVAPDGERVAFTRASGLYLQDRRIISALDWQPEQLAFSPDGTLLAYRVMSRTAPDKQLIGWADEKGEIGRCEGHAFAWDPASQSLVFLNTGRLLVGRVTVKGASERLTKLMDDGDMQYPPRVAVSPSGRRIAFTCRRLNEGASEVWLHETGGAKKLRSIPGAEAHLIPFWSPQSDTVGLHVVHVAQSKTVTVLLSGDQANVLAQSKFLDALVAPAWSPSGRSIALFRTTSASHAFSKTGTQQLVLADVASEQLVPVGSPGEFTGDLRFLDDRRLVIDGGPRAWVLTFATGI